MTENFYKLEAYDYELPPELIAQHPLNPRDHSRLMIVNRQTGDLSEIGFSQLREWLQEGDSLVLNNTKVLPARLMGKRTSGGETEILLSRCLTFDSWEVMARPGKKLKEGSRVVFGPDFCCEVLETTSTGTKIVKFFWEGSFELFLIKYGQMPLPPYIRRAAPLGEDLKDYQTVYAKETGAVAAPTAGLHFTDALMADLNRKGVMFDYLTLHVGLGTFKPVQTEDIRGHHMHTEYFSIDESVANHLNHRNQDKRQICVGTTCCRALESSTDENGMVMAGGQETNVFIYPGYQFKYVQSLLTNFHAPRSSLLMLVSAFAGYELIREAYRKAVLDRFRFHSYGDAMLIL